MQEHKQAFIARVRSLREGGLSQRAARSQAAQELTENLLTAHATILSERAKAIPGSYVMPISEEYSTDKVRLERTARGGKRFKRVMPTKSGLRADHEYEGVTRITSETQAKLRASAIARWNYLDHKAVVQIAFSLFFTEKYL